MIEPLFVSGPPMWTAVPPAGFTFQTPTAAIHGPVVGPAFSPSAMAGISGGVPGSTQGLSAPSIMSPNPYGYGGGGMTSQQNFVAPSVVGGLPFASAPIVSLVGPMGAETMGGVPAASILAAVALRRGQPQGPSNDQESEDFLYDALEFLPGAADVDIRCDAGRVTLTGSVQHKRVKRDIGEIAWAIPGLNDVQNNLTIAPRRRTRSAGTRETEVPPSASARKQS